MIVQIYHHWEKWECYKAGFYSNKIPENMTPDMCAIAYRDFLSNTKEFNNAIDMVFEQWPNSCEQFLTNENINRIAWIGQSSMCIKHGIPSIYKYGFRLLTRDQQIIANKTAENKLNKWIKIKFYERPQESTGIHREMETMRLF